MLSKKELKLINLIKYTPLFIVIFICLFITFLLYVDKNIVLKNDLRILQKEYLNKNQEIIKDEVNKVYDYILHKKLNSEEQLKKDIRNRVVEAHSVMVYIYDKYKDIETKEQITNRIKDSLRELRFNDNRGYFYIYDMDGYNILHPLLPNLENSNILDTQDVRIKDIFLNIKKELEINDEVYTEIYWEKPESLSSNHKKITFNKMFTPYDWHIGTGEYVEDFENNIKQEVLKYINTIKYSKNGYVFVVDSIGTYLAHVEKSYIGLNRINLEDANGFMITKEIIKAGEKGEDFLKYVGTIKPETKLPAEKITYVRGFQDWQWAIGTGFYTDELDKQIKAKEQEYKDKYINNLINLLIISLMLTLLFLSLSFYISKKLQNRFYKYKKQVLTHIKKDKEKDILLANQSKMASMGEMLENIAHQWRQPLSSISTISTGIKVKLEYSNVEKEEIISSMDIISSTTKYLSQTIDDFRDYFNPNKEISNFNLKNVFINVFDLLEKQLNQKEINLIKNLQDIYINGYKNELLQVIINILNNSKDQLEKNENKNKYIFIDIIKEENRVKLLIKDNAGGIPKEIIDKIFEPYFSTKFKSQGTGIGLYMSKEIIEKHMKGQITAYNEKFVYENISYTCAVFEITLFIELEEI